MCFLKNISIYGFGDSNCITVLQLWFFDVNRYDLKWIYIFGHLHDVCLVQNMHLDNSKVGHSTELKNQQQAISTISILV